MTRHLLICAAIGVMSVAGCSGTSTERSPLQSKVGKKCTVQFRRGDALGGASSLPVSPTTGEINGAQVNLIGTLSSVSRDWIVLESDGREQFIPRDAILLVQFAREP